MAINKRGAFVVLCLMLGLIACGDDDSSSSSASYNMDVVSKVSELPKCTKSNEGEMAWVKGESSARVCIDEKWFSTIGSDSSVTFSCTTKELKDQSGVKIICGGDSVGVVYNGKDGTDGKDGKNGKDGSSGKNGTDGVGCSIAKIDEQKVRVICGKDSTVLYVGLASDESAQNPVVVDSEKIAISLDEITGVTQKGPFLMGSKVLVHEVEDGRTLLQTGNSFSGKIVNDKGEFKINARTLVSQYVMLEATGYYRNEVTGQNSSSELTLFAISDVNNRNTVNVNLLTHLEHDRVIYLVTQKNMKVNAAKKKAQKEIFGLLGIDATEFSNSEDLNIAGASDEDGALLAFSLMFQGDRTTAELTELLQKISNDMKEDGTWDDAATRMKIAEWSADADGSSGLTTIRNNVASWGLSSKVPNFEQFVRNFWNAEYGLEKCTAKNAGTVKAASAGKRKGTKTRYICKDVDGDMRWVVASDIEKDIYGWAAGKDGEVKVGSITDTKYYLYDAVKREWREASVVEQQFGGCIESVAADNTKNTGFVNGYWYKCDNRNWLKTTAYIVDTQGWVKGSDGDIQKGDNTSTYYVYDEAENQWREASENDVNLGLMGCTTNRAGEMGRSSKNNAYYSCATNHVWTLLVGKVAYNTYGCDCDKDGKMLLGIVDTKSYFVCDAGVWREATVEEERTGMVCTKTLNGTFNKDSTIICDYPTFRKAHLYDFDVGVKNYFNPNVEYGSLRDKRDGRTYKTVVINGMTVMAENLNFADEGMYSYLFANNWCYNWDSTNCLKGGRYYTWTAAMDIDSKWKSGDVPEGTIKTPHQGICPDGWHIPSTQEWNALFKNIDVAALLSKGCVGCESATNASGFSALPVGYWDGSSFKRNMTAYFRKAEGGTWCVDASELKTDCGFYGNFTSWGYSVRCFKDEE